MCTALSGLKAFRLLLKSNLITMLRSVCTEFSKILLAPGILNTLRLVRSPVAEVNQGRNPDTAPQALKYPNIGPLATYMYTKGQSRNVTSDCTRNLPSWVVCWACPRCPTTQLLGQYSVDGGEKAMQNLRVVTPISSEKYPTAGPSNGVPPRQERPMQPSLCSLWAEPWRQQE